MSRDDHFDESWRHSARENHDFKPFWRFNEPSDAFVVSLMLMSDARIDDAKFSGVKVGAGGDSGASLLRKSVTEMIPALRGYARSLTRDAANADDLVQETLVRALAHIHQFKPGTNLKAWMFTILRNTHISLAKRRGRELSLMSSVEAEDIGRGGAQEWSSAKNEVQAALERLPSTQREVLVLIGGLGLSYEECAKICGCEMGTVKSRLNRARARLAALLGADTADEIL